MLLATFAVAVLPVLVVTAIQATGALRSTLSSIGAAAGLSIGASVAGAALWSRRRGARDFVFADLVLWGWVRRLRTERRLANVSELLGDRTKLSPRRQAELLERLSTALEARDPYTHGHSRRVTRYAEAIARRMGLTAAQVAKIRTAAAVHDVGKIETPRDVLNKPGRLTDEEFAAIKRHPADGARLVAGMDDPELTAMVRHHHERLDGRGYPDGLEAANIPLGARIIAVADTFDAITSTRPYRAGAKHKTALDILKKEAGSQLDPAAVGAFLSYYSGRRSVAWWGLLATEPPRLVSWLFGWLQGEGAAPIAKGVVAAGAAALIGGTMASPPSPKAGIRSSAAAAVTATHLPADRVSSGDTPALERTVRRTQADTPHSRDRAVGGAPPSRRRSSLPVKREKGSRSPGVPSPSSSNDAGREAHSHGGDSGGGGSSGGSGGSVGGGSGSADSGSGSNTASSPEPRPIVDAPEVPTLPVEVPIPEVEPPALPNIPGGDAIPEVQLPPVETPIALPRL
jgi:putative nucleotidyltransferase with HDIG domain